MFVIRLLNGQEIRATEGDEISINHDTGMITVTRIEGFERVATHYSPSAWAVVTHRVKDVAVNPVYRYAINA
ncbi:hypothetical protein MSM1_18400 [Mycobacterium sp. SM1]|uniref:hypothetical protein n=1 Tax=Mycobacterium sp. SM1 TaxID=2816243 RepID=UPI001BCBA28A|nr:hypothetical protein [Mycobacterium sp. SM1]MBS4730209.1 hypothetical protein [Mycobacterium sp. SM1]